MGLLRVGERIALLDVDLDLAARRRRTGRPTIACIASRVAMCVKSVCRVT